MSDCSADITQIMASDNTGRIAVSLVNLNSDVLLEIFSYLDHTSLRSAVCTCKVLKTVGYDPLLWKDTIVKIRSGVDITQSIAESFRERNLRIFMFSKPDFIGEIPMNERLEVECNMLLNGLHRCLETAHMDTLFFADLRQPPVVYPAIPTAFKHLRCLVLVKRWSDFDIRERTFRDPLQAALKQLDNLEKLVIKFTKKEELQPYYVDKLYMVNYVRLIIGSLAGLKDLEVIRPHDMDFYEGLQPTIDYDSGPSIDDVQVVPGLKRLSLNESYVDDPLFRNPNRFPNLEHLSLSFNDSSSFPHLLVPICRILENTPHLESLQIVSLGADVPALPILKNLKALRITPETSYSMIDRLSCLSQLQVLDLVPIIPINAQTQFTDWCVDLLSHLHNLRIMKFSILPNRFCPASHHKRLKQHATKISGLHSLIGLDFSEDLESLPSSLQYVTVRDNNDMSDDDHSLRLLERTCTGWIHVQRHSKAWHNANGTDFFIPVDSYPNLSDVQRFFDRASHDSSFIII